MSVSRPITRLTWEPLVDHSASRPPVTASLRHLSASRLVSLSMVYLILNILFSSCFILCVKGVQKTRSLQIVTVGCINYIAAALCAVPGFLDSEPSERMGHAIWTGGLMGTGYFVAFFFLIHAVNWVGASNSAAVSRVSLVIPICAGVWLWGESPDWFEISGIGLAFVSLSLIGRLPPQSIHRKSLEEKRDVARWLVMLVLGIFFLICGLTRLMQQSCQQLCNGVADYPTFLLAAFCCAAIPSIVVLVYRRQPIQWQELIVGILLGATNILQSHYILRSLDVFDGFLVFTVTSTGGLVFTTAIAVFYFKEKLNWQSGLGIGLASLAIVLLQLPVRDLLASSAP